MTWDQTSAVALINPLRNMKMDPINRTCSKTVIAAPAIQTGHGVRYAEGRTLVSTSRWAAASESRWNRLQHALSPLFIHSG